LSPKMLLPGEQLATEPPHLVVGQEQVLQRALSESTQVGSKSTDTLSAGSSSAGSIASIWPAQCEESPRSAAEALSGSSSKTEHDDELATAQAAITMQAAVTAEPMPSTDPQQQPPILV